LRFFNRRILLAAAGIAVLVILGLIAALWSFINSPRFEETAKDFIVREITKQTGAEASLDDFDWSIRQQRFVLRGLTIRGLEPPDHPPLAHVESIQIGVRLRTLLQRRVDLFELIVARPQFHLIVDRNGRTNLPDPPVDREKEKLDFQFSIDSIRIVDGYALINERKIDLDLELANLSSAIKYAPATRVLSLNLNYDGKLWREQLRPIPYTLSADLDYTSGVVVGHRIDVKSGKSLIKLQGRIDDVLTPNLHGRLEYTGKADVLFMKHFFQKERFSGFVDVAGFLEFSRGYFFTRGNAAADSVTLEEWDARNFRGDYAYHFPGRRLAVHNIVTRFAGGTANGSIAVEPIPGKPRVTLDMAYKDVDADKLARAYPWDRKYRIHSKLTGDIQGWFEGKFTRFSLGGHAGLTSYSASDAAPTAGARSQTAPTIALPLDGSADFHLDPENIQVRGAQLQLHSTMILADGLIHDSRSDLKVHLASSDLSDLKFVYANANGSGTFDGVLRGPIRSPEFEGAADISGYQHGEWKIERAAGNVRLDTLTRAAALRGVRITQGQSEIAVDGDATLDGAKVDLRIQAPRVRAEDVRTLTDRFVGRKFEGELSGNASIRSLQPIRLEATVRGRGLAVDGQRVGDAQGNIRYDDPVVRVRDLVVSDNGARLSGNAEYNRATEAFNFSVRVNSLDLARLRVLGFPAAVEGVVQEANFTGSGDRLRPQVQGRAVVRNAAFRGETFPEARVDVSSSGPRVKVRVDAARNLDLSAELDTSLKGVPFTARAAFKNYPIERLAGFGQGTASVSGEAQLTGLLTDLNVVKGSGKIEAAEMRVRDRLIQSVQPFTFVFDPNRLTLSRAYFASGEGAEVSVEGDVALTGAGNLDLSVKGVLDLALLSAVDPDLVARGVLEIDSQLAGTIQKPDLQGFAHLVNAEIGRKGFITSLSSVYGDIFFNENRVQLANVVGQAGGGTVAVQGTATIQNGQIGAMNIRIETDNVRIRYPEGLRTVVDGPLVLRGTWASPVLEGDLRIQSMSYRGAFEDFFALFRREQLKDAETGLGRLALSVHIEGSRDITIQNELADVEARVDLDIKGTVANPALTGHVEASGGTLTLRGQRYEITRGNIDFVDPLRIEPVLDIQAEADLRNYRVILAISGRGDNIRVDPRSDPPLSQIEIVNLIAGGRTAEELRTTPAAPGAPATGQPQPTTEQLQGLPFLADLIQQRVGPRFGLLGLNRVRIDPLLEAEDRPRFRVTVSEQVAEDLTVTYSQDLSTAEQQVIQIEYFVSRNVSLLATRDELGQLSLDLRWRQLFNKLSDLVPKPLR